MRSELLIRETSFRSLFQQFLSSEGVQYGVNRESSTELTYDNEPLTIVSIWEILNLPSRKRGLKEIVN